MSQALEKAMTSTKYRKFTAGWQLPNTSLYRMVITSLRRSFSLAHGGPAAYILSQIAGIDPADHITRLHRVAGAAG